MSERERGRESFTVLFFVKQSKRRGVEEPKRLTGMKGNLKKFLGGIVKHIVSGEFRQASYKYSFCPPF